MHRLQVFLRSSADPDEPETLYARIELVCDECGQAVFVLAGHHVRPLLGLLQSIVDRVNPALIEAGDVLIVDHDAASPADPRNN